MPSVLTERYTSLSLCLYPVSYTETRREKNPRIRVKVLCSRNGDRTTSMFMLIAVDTVAFQNLPANSDYETMATTV